MISIASKHWTAKGVRLRNLCCSVDEELASVLLAKPIWDEEGGILSATAAGSSKMETKQGKGTLASSRILYAWTTARLAIHT